jgi:hypothetical protein
MLFLFVSEPADGESRQQIQILIRLRRLRKSPVFPTIELGISRASNGSVSCKYFNKNMLHLNKPIDVRAENVRCAMLTL